MRRILKTSSKWASIAKCSQDSALRHISDLLERGVLRKSDASGRSTSYLIGFDFKTGHGPSST
jgi:Fic family protein